jgi:hypothetical protein
MYRFFQNALPDEFWLKCGIELLQPCDALATVVGWERSNGAQAEVSYAEDELKIPTFRDGLTAPRNVYGDAPYSIRNWIQQWKDLKNDQTQDLKNDQTR